jgi:hypothetical protein
MADISGQLVLLVWSVSVADEQRRQAHERNGSKTRQRCHGLPTILVPPESMSMRFLRLPSASVASRRSDSDR